MTDGDRREIATIVYRVLDERLGHMEKNIAAGFVEALECLMEDLAAVLEQRNDHLAANLLDKQRRDMQRTEAMDKIKRRVGF